MGNNTFIKRIISAVIALLIFVSLVPAAIAADPAEGSPLDVLLNDDGNVVISWSKAENAEYYSVYRSKSVNGEFVKIADSEKCEYIDDTIVTGCRYYYKVSTVTENGETWIGGCFSVLRTFDEIPMLTIVKNQDFSVTVSWNEIPEADGYYVYRAAKSVAQELIADTEDLSFTDNVPEPDVYTYSVTAYSIDGEDRYQSDSGQGTIALPLDMPANVKSTVNSSKVVVTWDAVDGAEGYIIYRSEAPDGEFTRVFKTENTKFTNLSTSPGCTYYYIVRAYASKDGETIEGVASDVTETGADIKLLAPKGVSTQTVSPTSMKVLWNSAENADKYCVFRAETKTGEYKKIAETSKNTYLDKGLTPGKTYYYKIKSGSSRTDAVTSEFSSIGYRQTRLATPQITSTKWDGKYMVVRWKAVPEADGYYVYRASSKDGKYTKVFTIDKNRYYNSGVTRGETYYYKVRAFYNDNTDCNSFLSDASPRADIPLKTPSGVKVETLSPTSMQITWKKVEGAAGYYVYRSTSKKPDSFKKMGYTTTNSYKNKTAEPGVTNYYRVVAFKDKADHAWDSEPSEPVGSLATICAPTITAKNSKSGVYVSWKAMSGAQKYVVYRKTENGSYQKMFTTSNTHYTNTSAKSGVEYTYKIRGYAKLNGKEIYGIYSNEETIKCRRLDPDKPMIALTFDDGPSIYTDAILDQLEKYDARATFFVLGDRASSYSDEIKRAHDLGCQIGSHSYSHSDLSSLSSSGIKSDLSKTDAAIKKITGESPEVLRPPYGAVNSTLKSTSPYPLIIWSVDTNDWSTQSTTSTYNHVLKYASDGDIVLMHDIYKATKNAAIDLIPELIRRGYQLVTVSELAECKGVDMVSGKCYYYF